MKKVVILIVFLIVSASPGYGEMYKWVDEKGDIHFADDLSKIPEKYRPDAETWKPSKDISLSEPKVKRTPSSTPLIEPKAPGIDGFEVHLIRRHELWLTEVTLNGRLRQHFVLDTGASFMLINWRAVRELGITIDESTPFIRIASVSDVFLTPLVTLKSVQVGKADLENVDAIVYNMSSYDGLLGNSFLNKFRINLDSINEKMVLYSLQGTPSPDRPGGYSRDYWIGQFRFYHRNLEELRRLKARFESQRSSSELKKINNAIQYFENQLSELERKASFAGVPRNWRE